MHLAHAHNIGPVYTHPGQLPHFSVNRIGNESVETYIRDHVVELVIRWVVVIDIVVHPVVAGSSHE